MADTKAQLNGPATVRNAWFEDATWDEAKRITAERGETIAGAILRPALDAYVRKHTKAAARAAENPVVGPKTRELLNGTNA
jgi:hypothetical protein